MHRAGSEDGNVLPANPSGRQRDPVHSGQVAASAAESELGGRGDGGRCGWEAGGGDDDVLTAEQRTLCHVQQLKLWLRLSATWISMTVSRWD